MCERVENPSMNSNRIPMEKFKNNTHGKICQNSALRLKVPESDNLKERPNCISGKCIEKRAHMPSL